MVILNDNGMGKRIGLLKYSQISEKKKSPLPNRANLNNSLIKVMKRIKSVYLKAIIMK